jgi:hypothetical protein
MFAVNDGANWVMPEYKVFTLAFLTQLAALAAIVLLNKTLSRFALFRGNIGSLIWRAPFVVCAFAGFIAFMELTLALIKDGFPFFLVLPAGLAVVAVSTYTIVAVLKHTNFDRTVETAPWEAWVWLRITRVGFFVRRHLKAVAVVAVIWAGLSWLRIDAPPDVNPQEYWPTSRPELVLQFCNENGDSLSDSLCTKARIWHIIDRPTFGLLPIAKY